ncbi:Na+/H+ antiporter subunit E [Fervidobacterium sp. 2310opik-2]|mgnify:FL=1|uniref:Na+/H+ antiporter subunit E n=1 Tax=Fervidobacterium sp. 2310opik-2 TaxID=1755815 RepID=UPI0013DE86C8|nr:Na+/H+ antiporter subunit E [Fervidobacterium sp. 2310opik-2]KAF2961873.1 cation:proton antiporter [Fervidobacterium sp. 2310opik-2]
MSFSVFIVSFFTWLLLTWSVEWQEVVIGLVVSLVISLIFTKYYRIKFNGKFIPGLFKFLFVYIPVFVWEMIKANLDVASRVLVPGRNVKPGFVKVKTALKGDVAKLTLANSITLTPGTITFDVVDDELYVHWIDVAGTDEESKKSFYGKFEKILKGVYE